MSTSPLPAFYRFAPLVTFLVVTGVNFYPFDDRRFEDDADTLVTAAGYAFSIWGVIFLGLIGFSVVLARSGDSAKAAGGEPDTPHLRRAIVGLCVAGLASIAFVPISIGGDQVLGFLDVAVHLVALIYAYGHLRRHVPATPPRPRRRAFWFYGPSMYLGWISAATVIAASLALDQLGFEVAPSTGVLLAAALVVVLLAIGWRFQVHADHVYGLTVAWALVGVGVKQGAVPALRYLAWAAAAVLVVHALLRWRRGAYGFYATPGYYDADGAEPRGATPSRSTTSSVPS